LDLDEFDLDHEFENDAFYDEDFEMMKKKIVRRNREVRVK
jgi:hypothetical protein